MFTPQNVHPTASPADDEILISGDEDGIPRNITVKSPDAKDLRVRFGGVPPTIPNPAYEALKAEAFTLALDQIKDA